MQNIDEIMNTKRKKKKNTKTQNMKNVTMCQVHSQWTSLLNWMAIIFYSSHSFEYSLSFNFMHLLFLICSMPSHHFKITTLQIIHISYSSTSAKVATVQFCRWTLICASIIGYQVCYGGLSGIKTRDPWMRAWWRENSIVECQFIASTLTTQV